MSTPIVLIAIVLAVFLAYALLSPLLMNLTRFIVRPWLYCPVNDAFGHLSFNAFGAALASGYGDVKPRVKGCSLLKKNERCEAVCLKGHEF